MENLDNSHLQTDTEAIMLFNESTPWAVSKKKWEGKGKSIMHALYLLWYAKRHLLG